MSKAKCVLLERKIGDTNDVNVHCGHSLFHKDTSLASIQERKRLYGCGCKETSAQTSHLCDYVCDWIRVADDRTNFRQIFPMSTTKAVTPDLDVTAFC